VFRAIGRPVTINVINMQRNSATDGIHPIPAAHFAPLSAHRHQRRPDPMVRLTGRCRTARLSRDPILKPPGIGASPVVAVLVVATP